MEMNDNKVCFAAVKEMAQVTNYNAAKWMVNLWIKQYMQMNESWLFKKKYESKIEMWGKITI